MRRIPLAVSILGADEEAEKKKTKRAIAPPERLRRTRSRARRGDNQVSLRNDIGSAGLCSQRVWQFALTSVIETDGSESSKRVASVMGTSRNAHKLYDF